MKMLKILQENQNVITAENRESFELLNQILDFAQNDLMDELNKVEFGEDDPRLLYVFFLARPIKNGISIFTLSSEGLNEDTSILLRALIEQVGYIYFIATLEDKSKILEQFGHHEYCRVKRYRKQIKKVSPGHQFPDDDVEKKCEEYQNKFHKNDIYWTGRNTSDILKEVITKFPNKDFGRLYLKWSLLSNFVHSSQMAFESIVQPESTISLAPDPSQLREDLIWTDICLLDILELINRACSILDVKYIAPFSGFLVFIEDIQGCDYIMLDDMNKDIVVSHVSVIDFHMVSVFLGQSVVSFDSSAEFF